MKKIIIFLLLVLLIVAATTCKFNHVVVWRPSEYFLLIGFGVLAFVVLITLLFRRKKKDD